MPFYQNTKNELINVSGQPVNVAAVFNPMGEFKPLHICLEDLYGNVCKTKIEKINYHKDIRGGVSFNCSYKAGDDLRRVVLNYYIKEHIWVIEN